VGFARMVALLSIVALPPLFTGALRRRTIYLEMCRRTMAAPVEDADAVDEALLRFHASPRAKIQHVARSLVG